MRALKLTTLLPFVLLAAIAAGGWHQLVAPKRAEATRLAAEVDSAGAELAQLQSKVAEYSKARDAYAANVGSVTRLGKAVPADDDLRSLMVQLDAATRRSGVDFRSILVSGDGAAVPESGAAGSGASATVTPGDTIPGAVVVPGSDISTMPFTFAFEGNYFELSGFLARLQRFVTVRGEAIEVNGRLLRIESINLKPSEAGFPSIEAQVKASSFVAPAARSATGTGAPAPATGVAPTEGSAPSQGADPAAATADASGAAQ